MNPAGTGSSCHGGKVTDACWQQLPTSSADVTSLWRQGRRERTGELSGRPGLPDVADGQFNSLYCLALILIEMHFFWSFVHIVFINWQSSKPGVNNIWSLEGRIQLPPSWRRKYEYLAPLIWVTILHFIWHYYAFISILLCYCSIFFWNFDLSKFLLKFLI